MKKRLLFIVPGLLGLFLSSCSNSSPSKPSGGGGGEPQVEQFTITFKDEVGTVLESKKWDKDSIPSYTYNKIDTAEWDYTVEGWSLSQDGEVITIPAATEDATYWAIVSKVKKSYKITFYNENNTEIKSENLDYGVQPSCDYTGPSDTIEWDYTFRGWATSRQGTPLSSIPTVSADANYYAIVDKIKQTYEIQWCENDGHIISTSIVPFGTTPSYNYETSSSMEWVYTFLGWSDTPNGEVLETLPSVTGNATYYAQVSKTQRLFSVSFYDENTILIKTDSLGYQAQPVCDYTGPVDTAEWDYEFLGWATTHEGTPLANIPVVSGDANYHAVVSKTKKSYEIKFYENDGTLLDSTSYLYGETPSYDYEDASDDEWKCTFVGWATSKDGEPLDSLPAVTGEASYFAQVNKVKKQYTITFISNGDTSVDPITEDYGTQVAKPSDPSKDGYHFAGWSTDQAGQNKVTWPLTLVKNETLYGNWNENIDLKSYFQTLMGALTHDPYGYIPNEMKPEANIKELADLEKDYTTSQNVNSIEFGGHGEQWNMVLTNLQQSQTFYKVLSTGSEVITAASVVVNNWIDSDPSDIASHEFKETEYTAKISYKNKVLNYTLQYKTGWDIPVVGEILPQIDMSYDITEGTKTFRIQLNSENAIKYVVADGYYAFGMELKAEIAGKTGSRKAYFEITSDEENGEVEGHIYEFLTYKTSEESEEKTVLPACADFYINEDYVSVVGNKASGLVGFAGYITELYNAETGKLVVYKVEETFEKWSITKTYNTLFFNLENISGISSVKAISNGSVDPHENNHDVYVNGKDSKFVATKNKVGFISTSRKYDIEMRKQYFYTLDSDSNPVKHEVLTPMMFIQDNGTESGETNYSTFEADILKDNSIVASVNLAQAYLDKVREDYLTLIPLFKENKDNQTSDTISEFIGEAQVIE